MTDEQVPRMPVEQDAETLTIPDSVKPLAAWIAERNRHPAVSPLSEGTMIEMPCCGTRFDVEAIDCVPGVPSTVYWPPRWTCLQCDQTFTPNEFTGDLEPVAANVAGRSEAKAISPDDPVEVGRRITNRIEALEKAADEEVLSRLFVWRTAPLYEIEPQHTLPNGAQVSVGPDWFPARPEDVSYAAIERIAGDLWEQFDWERPGSLGKDFDLTDVARAAVQALLGEDRAEVET